MLAPNTLLRNGRYRIVRPIAQGGQGAVYQAWDLRLNAHVAVKEALVDDPVLNRAFEREAQRLIRLRHAGLPRGIEYFLENGKQYFVMEYIGGMDLNEQLKEQQGSAFSVRRVLAWADQLLELLTYLHEQTSPLIHRDIKPANLKVRENGNIILLDFGLAKGGLTEQTRGRSLQGYTRSYAPLEQILGSPTNERSDLYALGATLYTLLTGEAPPDALARYALITANQPDELRLANLLNPDIPTPFAQLLAQAMHLNSTGRPASARAMREILHRSVYSYINHSQKRSQSSAPAPYNKKASQNQVNSLPAKHPVWTSLRNALIIISLSLVISGLTIILMSNAAWSGNVPPDSTAEVNLTATQIVLAADNSPTAPILATPTNTQSPTVPTPTSTPQPSPTVPTPTVPQPSPTAPPAPTIAPPAPTIAPPATAPPPPTIAPRAPTSTPQPLPTAPPPPTIAPSPTQPAATATQQAVPPTSRATIQSGNWYGTVTTSNFNGCLGFEIVNSSEVRNVMVSLSGSTNGSNSIRSTSTQNIKGSIKCINNNCYVSLFCSEQENYLNNNAFESCEIIVGTFTSDTAASGRMNSSSEINGSKISGDWFAEPSTKVCQ